MLKMKALFVGCFLYTGMCVADDVQLVGTISQTMHAPTKSGRLYAHAVNKEQVLQLLAIKLNAKGQHALQARLTQPMTAPPTEGLAQAGSAKQLGMNGVPVLNQGMHGTCATFAVTAAMDAALNKQDGISQLCQLLLGSYLEEQGYSPSGWDGAMGFQMLAQMDTFGVVTKAQERSVGCAGLYDYPRMSPNAPVEKMSVEAYHQLSEELDHSPKWYPILHIAQFARSVNTQLVFAQVKNALKQGDRVVLGSLIISPEDGVVGAVGTYHVRNDTWVLTPKLRLDIEKTQNFAAHELVITGFDDQAISTDDSGGKHQGLLTLRNSWGSDAGDQGEFYMSYDYFRMLVLEAYRILS